MHTSYWEEYSIICCKSKVLALISWLSVVLQKGKVASLIPSQGTCLDFGQGPYLGALRGG